MESTLSDSTIPQRIEGVNEKGLLFSASFYIILTILKSGVVSTLYNARFGQVSVGEDRMNYVEFGTGERILVMIPGLSDGFAPVSKFQAPFLAFGFRQLAADFHVYCFSRRNLLPMGCTTRDMARDQAAAMRLLGIQKADVLGVSQGGAIAQYLAIDHPHLIKNLILAVTFPQTNDVVRGVVPKWMELAGRGGHKKLMIDTAEHSYSDDYLLKYRLLYPILGVGKPKSFERFLIQAESCLHHNACAELGQIQCPTLIIGGSDDRIVGTSAARELAEKIPGSQLYVYKGLGHAAYEEAPDFQMRIKKFLLR